MEISTLERKGYPLSGYMTVYYYTERFNFETLEIEEENEEFPSIVKKPSYPHYGILHGYDETLKGWKWDTNYYTHNRYEAGASFFMYKENGVQKCLVYEETWVYPNLFVLGAWALCELREEGWVVRECWSGNATVSHEEYGEISWSPFWGVSYRSAGHKEFQQGPHAFTMRVVEKGLERIGAKISPQWTDLYSKAVEIESLGWTEGQYAAFSFAFAQQWREMTMNISVLCGQSASVPSLWGAIEHNLYHCNWKYDKKKLIEKARELLPKGTLTREDIVRAMVYPHVYNRLMDTCRNYDAILNYLLNESEA